MIGNFVPLCDFFFAFPEDPLEFWLLEVDVEDDEDGFFLSLLFSEKWFIS